MLLRKLVNSLILAIACAVLSQGCAGPTETPAPTPVDDTVLVIERGDLADTVVMGGTPNAELLRFDVRNVSHGPVELRLLPVGLSHEDGTPAAAGSFADVKFADGAALRTLMGPLELRPEVGGNLYFTNAVTIAAGETMTFVLRADVGTSAGRYLITVGSLAALLEDVVSTVSGERIPDRQIRNNRILGRIVQVLAPPVSGETVVIAEYRGDNGLYIPSGFYNSIGTLCLTSYGGPAFVRQVRMGGANLHVLNSLMLNATEAGFLAIGTVPEEGPVTLAPIAERFPDGIPLREAEALCVDVFSADARPGVLLMPFYGSTITAMVQSVEAVDAREVEARLYLHNASESHLVFHETVPNLIRQPLSTTTIVNGVAQDLIRFQVVGTFERTVSLGSLTFRVTGLTAGRSLANFRVRVGSTERETVLVYVSGTTTDLRSGTLTAPLDTAQFTVVFPDGLEVSGSGQVISVMAEPSGFVAGDTLTVMFGDRFPSTAGGTLGADGRIDFNDGADLGPVIDAVVWTYGNAGGRWFGSMYLTDTSFSQTLTR